VRVKYEIGGVTFHMRTFTGRDIARVTGKLAVLPVTPGALGMSAWQSNDLVDGLLAICSRSPKLTLDEPDVVPEGTYPICELSDLIYLELIKRLSQDSGFSAEAADEIRPTVETKEHLEPSTPSV
jgi:hypothetical protein